MTLRGRLIGWLASGLLVGAAGFVSVPAAAAAGADPLWYFDAMRIGAIHDAGITGEGVTIAVFDDEINPDLPGLQDADIEIRELEGCPTPVTDPAEDYVLEGHGSSVTSLIAGNGTSETGIGAVGIAPGVKILYYGVLDDECRGDTLPVAMNDAVDAGADIINFSGGSASFTEGTLDNTVASVAAALQAGVTIVASLPNANSAFESVLTPMNGVVNVASVDAAADVALWADGTPMAFDDVDVVAPGIDVAGVGWDGTWGMSTWSGNSAATPIVSSVIALAMQKWPDATPNQILQSLIHNTGSDPHELSWSNTIGHGVVNATRLLAENPTQYPDENPLFKDDQRPTLDEAYPTPTPEPTTPPVDTATTALPWAIGATAIVIIGIGAATAITINRRKKQGGSHDV
ncbi:hypothetical protein CW368_12165 [Actinomycetales bacterium SN12]|nr:hypothetical protein CW368_12165 [Actinomycetales bacterium SN12]